MKPSNKNHGELVWLHISDIHFSQKNDWRDSFARDKLLDFLNDIFTGNHPKIEQHRKPDLIFCTGDIASEGSGQERQEQYNSAANFFKRLQHVCGLKKNRVFIVPGNHDVDRKEISESGNRLIDGIIKDAHANMVLINGDIFPNRQNDSYFHSLKAYDNFLNKNFSELAKVTEPNRHFYAREVTIGGYKIGVAGLNSAWSCTKNRPKGAVLLGGEYQLNHCQNKLKKSDLKIVLSHHPPGWLTGPDDTYLTKRMTSDFDFLLTGHKHDDWVSAQHEYIHLAAGAIGADTSPEHGCNLVRIFPPEGRGEVYLFRFDTNGWTKKTLAGKADNGVYAFDLPKGSRDQKSSDVAAETERTVQDTMQRMGESVFAFTPPYEVPQALPVFIGRQAIRNKITNRLATSNDDIGLWGMGGIGKSELAKQIVNDCIQKNIFSDGILWLRVHNRVYEELLDEIWKSLGGKEHNQSVGHHERILKEQLLGKRMLVVLDNCDTAASLPSLQKLFSRQPILVTSRPGDSLRIAWELIDVFTEEESLELLRSLHPQLRREKDKELLEVAILLGFLPLALTVAGAWLRNGRGAKAYCEYFQKNRLNAVQREGDDPRMCDIRACFDVSWNDLEALDKSVLAVCCLFGGASFPESLLLKLFSGGEKKLELNDSEICRRVDRLVQSALLVRPEPDRLVVHALLRDYGREKKESLTDLTGIDTRTLGKVLREAISDGGASFASHEKTLIEDIIVRLLPWPEDSYHLFENVDSFWVKLGYNELRLKIVSLLLDSIKDG